MQKLTSINEFEQHEFIAHFYCDTTESLDLSSKFIFDAILENQRTVYFSESGNSDFLFNRILGYSTKLKKSELKKYLEIIEVDKNQSNKPLQNYIIDRIENLAAETVTTIKAIINFTQSNQYKELRSTNIVAYLNRMCLKEEIIMLCQYEINQLNSYDVFNLLKTHTKIIENNFIHNNPFYIQSSRIIEKIVSNEEKVRRLTPKEFDILKCITSGLSNNSISEKFGISRRTVETHRSNIMKKLEANTLVDLVKFAIINGIV